MGMMDQIKERPLRFAGVVILLVFAVGLLWRTFLRGPAPVPTPDTRYYVDLETGEIFEASRADAPSESPDGNDVAIAAVFTCGDDEDRFLGYAMREDPDDTLVSRDLRNWYSMEKNHDPQAINIMRVRCEDGSMARRLRP